MRISGQEIDPEIARAHGVEKQNQKLIEQLKHFEKESFEIEARVKQSRET